MLVTAVRDAGKDVFSKYVASGLPKKENHPSGGAELEELLSEDEELLLEELEPLERLELLDRLELLERLELLIELDRLELDETSNSKSSIIVSNGDQSPQSTKSLESPSFGPDCTSA